MPSPLIIFLLLLIHLHTTLALTSDGALLLAFKYSITTDTLSTLDNWHYSDPTPCSWTGVTCNPTDSSVVTSLSLPYCQLTGTLPPDLFLLPNLTHLDLSSNSINDSLPSTLFNSSSLLSISLADNQFTGELPPLISPTTIPLSSLNLSVNSLTGQIPPQLAKLPNLTLLSLHHNSLTGNLPTGFTNIQILDLSSNQLNGKLPSNLAAGTTLRSLNLSNNGFSGQIPDTFAITWPENTTVDLSYNNFTGQIPPAKSLLTQQPESFAGNPPGLCGKPLVNPCAIPSTISNPPNATGSISISPAIAVIPKTSAASDDLSRKGGGSGEVKSSSTGLKPTTIAGIIVADLAGIVLLGVGLMYLYQVKKKKKGERNQSHIEKSTEWPTTPSATKNSTVVNRNITATGGIGVKELPQYQTSHCCCCCINTSLLHDESASTSSTSRLSSSCSNDDDTKPSGSGNLVMVDGETELEMETLLKASAYILGATGSSIVYKAVLQNGAAFAVRRLGGEIITNKIKRESFEGQIRGITKLRHVNLIRVRGFYWSIDEKLVITDYISNGNLASATTGTTYRKAAAGSSPMPHLPFETRLKIARGIARGLAYIHEKKLVHGNLKPTNILLTQEMEPVITDLGINSIINNPKLGTTTTTWSGRHNNSSRRSTPLLLDVPLQDTAASIIGTSPCLGSSSVVISPYMAPESTKNLKPNSKWDVYSFGVVLLELLTGRVFLERELISQQWTPVNNGIAEDRYWALRMADPAIKADVHGREEAVEGIFKLGFQCASVAPQKRPSMKEVLQVVERVVPCLAF